MRSSLALLLLASAVVGVGCAKAPRAAGAGTAPLNLLLVTLDTVRADHLGCYGYAAAETPALDGLARQGLRFSDASSTVPLTLPSHATLLSGLLPPHHGVRANGGGAFPADRATLATRLSAAGYRTAAFVAAFVLDHRFGLGRGFEVYDDDVARDPGAPWTLEAERPGDQVVDRALAWLGKADSRPFFLWVHLYDAHAPYAPPSPQRERHPGRPYDGEIAFVDQQVGRLLTELERRGWSGRTVVAVAADHGEGLGEHGEATHGLLLYEATLRVPLLLRAPGLAPRVVAAPVSLVDVAPTLAGLLAQPLAPLAAATPNRPNGRSLDGRDLSADLTAGRDPSPSDLYAETRYPEIFGWSPLAALRRRQVKYIAAPAPELYDLGRDPGEATNLLAGGKGDGAARGFASRLAAIEAGSVAPTPATRGIDAETRARLASLGYAAPGRSPAPPAGSAGASHRALPDPKAQVGLFERYQRAHAALLHGDAAALPELAALVAADPANPVFRGQLARAYRERGDYARSLPLYRQATAEAPDDPEAWYGLAVALQEAGRTGEARTAIETAVRLDPSRPEAHNTLGIVNLAENRPEPARQAFARAVELDPKNAQAWNNLGNVLRALGRLDEAESAYGRAIGAAPRYAEPLNGLGTLAVQRDRPREALPLFDRALGLAPGYHEVRLNRAIAFEMAGDVAAALSGYRDFLARSEGHPELQEQRRAALQLLTRLRGRSGAKGRAGGP